MLTRNKRAKALREECFLFVRKGMYGSVRNDIIELNIAWVLASFDFSI